MALFTCIARQVPEALEPSARSCFDGVRLGAKHESAFTTNRHRGRAHALQFPHQKLFEQTSLGRTEQQTAQSLDRIAKRFEETANQCAARLQVACGEFQTATKEHHAAATKAQNWVARVSLETRVWPASPVPRVAYVACATTAHFLATGCHRHDSALPKQPCARRSALGGSAASARLVAVSAWRTACRLALHSGPAATPPGPRCARPAALRSRRGAKGAALAEHPTRKLVALMFARAISAA